MINLESDIREHLNALNEMNWTRLQIEMHAAIANAKFYAFADQCERVAELVRLGLLPKPTAADYLDVAAIHNRIYFDYGRDQAQFIMADAFREAGA